MVKHTQTICQQKSTNCLSVFDDLVGLALKGLMLAQDQNTGSEITLVIPFLLSYGKKKLDHRSRLSYFREMLPFYSPLKRQETSGSMIVSGGIERKHRPEIV